MINCPKLCVYMKLWFMARNTVNVGKWVTYSQELNKCGHELWTVQPKSSFSFSNSFIQRIRRKEVIYPELTWKKIHKSQKKNIVLCTSNMLSFLLFFFKIILWHCSCYKLSLLIKSLALLAIALYTLFSLYLSILFFEDSFL